MTNQPLEITPVLLELHHVSAPLLQITVVSYYKLRQICYKLQQNIITNYGSFVTNYNSALLQNTVASLQITAKCYYKLRQLYYKLQQCVITNYDSFIKLLQIMAAFGVITNYDNTYHKLRRNSDQFQSVKFVCSQYLLGHLRKQVQTYETLHFWHLETVDK